MASMRKLLLLWAALLATACTTVGSAAPAAATRTPDVVKGRAGPFAAATVTIERTGSDVSGGFSTILDTGTGRRFPLTGPDEPADFFIVEPRAVMFAPVDASRANAVIVLYDSSRIGPGNGTDHKVLVYRVVATGVTRLRDVEARLDGAVDAATVRARLAKAETRGRR